MAIGSGELGAGVDARGIMTFREPMPIVEEAVFLLISIVPVRGAEAETKPVDSMALPLASTNLEVGIGRGERVACVVLVKGVVVVRTRGARGAFAVVVVVGALGRPELVDMVARRGGGG